MTLPALPTQGSTSWYTWATGMHNNLANQDIVNLAPLRKWQRAKARVRTSTADAKVLCVGDSTTAGIGVVDGTTQGVTGAYPAQLAALLSASGLSAARGLGIPAPAGLSDARWTLGTGWSPQTSLAWAGTADYAFSGGTFGNLVYADAGVLADRFDVYYLTGGGLGNITVTATGGSGTVQSTNAASGMGKVTVSAASAATTNTVTITPSAAVHIFAVEPWLSTAKRVRVGNAGVGSATATAWASDGVDPVWNSQSCIKAYAPDLTIISLGLNDAGSNDSAATYLGHVAPLITAAQVSGDVLLLPPMPPASSMGGTYVSLIADYTAGLRGLGLPVVDLAGRWVSGDAVQTLGLYWDARHPNAVGYSDLAQLLARGLLAA